MSDHWNGIANLLGTPSLNPIKKSETSSKPAKQAVEKSETSENTSPPIVETPKPKPEPSRLRSSWDAVAQFFGVSAPEPVAESASPQTSTRSRQPEPKHSAPRKSKPSMWGGDEKENESNESRLPEELPATRSQESDAIVQRPREGFRDRASTRQENRSPREGATRDPIESSEPDRRSSRRPPRRGRSSESDEQPTIDDSAFGAPGASHSTDPAFPKSGRESPRERTEVHESRDVRERSSGDRPERSNRPERSTRPERSSRSEQAERPERAVRPIDRAGDRPERQERSDRSVRADSSDRPVRPERTVRSERSERPDRPETSDRSNRSAPPERSDRPERFDRQQRPERGSTQEVHTDRASRSERPTKSEADDVHDRRPSRGRERDVTNPRDSSQERRASGPSRPSKATGFGAGLHDESEPFSSNESMDRDEFLPVDDETTVASEGTKDYDDREPRSKRRRGRGRGKGKERGGDETEDTVNDDDAIVEVSKNTRIPSWQEAIGTLVAVNMENHQRNPGHGRGQRGRGPRRDR